MNCDICMESDVGPEHDITEKHIKNKVLYDYLLNRKQFAGNRKGIVVTCNVKSSFTSLAKCVEARNKVSTKPDQEVIFDFTIANDSKKDDIMIIFVQMVHTKLNFSINNHGLGLGCTPQRLAAKSTLNKEIIIKFKSSHIGQYEMPIIFCFRKKATDENVVIMRDMIVYVEEKQTMHEKEKSPYGHKEVWAKELFKCPRGESSFEQDMFRIPKNFKPIYACAMKLKDDAPQAQLDLAADIKDIFATGVTKENYIRFFHNLLWYEETVVRINLKKYNMSAVPVMLHGDSFAIFVPGLSEKRPSLMIGDMLFIKLHDDDEVMFEAKISDIQENMINIREIHEEFYNYYTRDGRYDVRFFMSRLPLERMHAAVQSITKASQECRAFPVANTKIRKTKPIVEYFNHLVENNVEQRSVVEHILVGTCGTAPYLLHGPPGTGKTVTIVEAILQLVKKDSSNRILVCTDSNMAADHVAMMLIKHTHLFTQRNLLLRANSKYRGWDTLPDSLVQYSNGYDRNSFESVSIQTFKSFNIVVTTLSHAAKFAKQLKAKNMKRSISHLFIDEAAQAAEPACLIPVCGLLAPAGLLVLAGDPHQLGPVIISHNARKLGLGLSLMERLKLTCHLYSDERNDPNYMVMLRNNFRSNPDILEIPNKLFYKGQLRALASDDPISRVDILTGRMNSRSIIFHGVLSKEQKIGKSPSFFNNMELEIVQKYVTVLVSDHKVVQYDIGIVTPYIRQVYQMKSWLQNKGYDKIEVGTVEAFQGKEKRIIIISTVRANCGLLDHDAKFQLGFLVDDKRFNVALTRAKAKAIVIGNPLCLQKDLKWRSYIQKCRESGTYLGFNSEQGNYQDAQKEIVQRIMPVLKGLNIANKTRV